MEYLSVKEVAELKGCSVRYVRKCVTEQKIEAVIECNSANNCNQYMIPVSALPDKLQQKYYSSLNIVVSPAAECMPAVCETKPEPAKTAVVTQIKKRDIGSFSAEEREVISWWCEILRDWRIKRQGYDSLEEGDMVFIAETKRLRKEFMTAHGITLSRDIMYRKYKYFKAEDWAGLAEQRGGHNKGRNSIPEELGQAFCNLYLCDSEIPVSDCYRLTREWAIENRPELLADMPSERTFRRYVDTIPEAVVKYFRYSVKECIDDCLPYIIRLYDDIEANDVWVADNHTFDFMTRTNDGTANHRLYIMIYVIQVTPTNEMKVRADLKREGIAAYVPRRELIIRKSGGWTKVIPVMLPSYVFLDCDYCPEIHHIVKSVDGVLNWLGKPTPITGGEEEFMWLIINGGVPIPESTADVDNDRNVTITGGWLMGNEQYITGHNFRKKRALLEIRFGGRLHRTSVGVEYTKV